LKSVNIKGQLANPGAAEKMGIKIRDYINTRYLGDMLSVEGDADAAVETRIRIGWNKFRHLVPLLTNKDISLTVRD